MIEQVFLHAYRSNPAMARSRQVVVAQAGPRGLQVAREAFDIGTAGLEEAQLVLVAPASVLAQAQLLRFAGGTL